MIKNLSLENFKCFNEKFEFSLSKFNIFAGFNGRGKSSVFQSILLLSQSLLKTGGIEELEINGEFVRLGLFEDLVNENHRNIEGRINSRINIGFQLSGSNSHHIELGYKVVSGMERFGQLDKLIIDGSDFFNYSNSDIESPSGNNTPAQVHSLSSYPKGYFDELKNVDFVSAHRLGPVAYEEKDDLKINNPIGINGEHALTYLAKNHEALEKANRWLSEIMDGGELSVATDLHSSVVSLSIRNNSREKFRAINCGFGYSYILPIIIDAVTLQKGYLFIENPEAHLHPKAQSTLVKMLCEELSDKDVQVFIETHSEHILNGLRLQTLMKDDLKSTDSCFYFFDKDFQIRKLTMDDDGQMDDWPTGFFDQQELDLSKILQLGLLK